MPTGTPLSIHGTKRKAPTKRDKKEAPTRVRGYHAGGPTIRQKFKWRDPSYPGTDIYSHIPRPTLSPVDDAGNIMTEAALTARRKDESWIPTYFANPMQDIDYMVIEAITTSSIVGPIASNLSKFAVGTGMRPELELTVPEKDPDKHQKLLEEGQHIIDDLMQIDRNVEAADDTGIAIPFIDNILSMVNCTNTYNRSALVFGYNKPVEVNSKTYSNIPDSLKFAHARDLGIIEVDPHTWNLKSVQWRNASEMVQSTDMIYLWHPEKASTYHNATWYGASMILPMLDAARVLRKVIAQDFQAIAEATWARMPIITIAPQGQLPEEKRAEYADLVQRFVTGGTNLLLEMKDNVMVHDIDFNPKIDELVNMCHFLTKYCVSCLGMPQSMFLDEGESNRASLLGKIQLAISTVIKPLRETYGRQISAQWYNRWFRVLYGDKPEYQKYRIKTVFDDLHVAQWFDLVEPLNELDSRHQLTANAYGDSLGLPNYPNMLDPDGETQAGGSGNKISIGDGKGGQLDIKSRRGMGANQK